MITSDFDKEQRKKLVEKWRKTGLLEGLKYPASGTNFAMLLEANSIQRIPFDNDECMWIKPASGTTSIDVNIDVSRTGATFCDENIQFTFPLVRRILSQLPEGFDLVGGFSKKKEQ